MVFFSFYNDIVIEWLHKQLNDEALNRPLGGNFSMRPVVGNTFGGIDFDKYAAQPSVEVFIR